MSVSSFCQILGLVSERELAHSRSLTAHEPHFPDKIFLIRDSRFELIFQIFLLWRKKNTIQFKFYGLNEGSTTENPRKTGNFSLVT